MVGYDAAKVRRGTEACGACRARTSTHAARSAAHGMAYLTLERSVPRSFACSAASAFLASTCCAGEHVRGCVNVNVNVNNLLAMCACVQVTSMVLKITCWHGQPASQL